MTRNQQMCHQCRPSSAKYRRHLGNRVFVWFLGSLAVFYSLILGYHMTTPRRVVVSQSDWVDCCRELFFKYGLVPTGHIASDAKAFLEATRAEETNGLTSPSNGVDFQPVASQIHPLLGEQCPVFELKDDRGEPRKLSEFIAEGPVVLVFYYGYHCSHCVAQLFGLQEDFSRFHDAGISIVALSGDASEMTAARMAEYGRFDFPVLSDPGNQFAEKFGVFRPAATGVAENLLHGTFLIDQSGIVVWAYMGSKPFTDNRTLLSLLSVAPHPALADGFKHRSPPSEK